MAAAWREEERMEGACWNSHIILERLIAIHAASAIFSSPPSNATNPPRHGRQSGPFIGILARGDKAKNNSS